MYDWTREQIRSILETYKADTISTADALRRIEDAVIQDRTQAIENGDL